MPLLFSYGTLQHENVQLGTIGRRLKGQHDTLPRFSPSTVKIGDPDVAATLGKTHHANATFTGNDADRVDGTALEVTDADLIRFDEYEQPFSYERVTARLASGRQAWVYVHAYSGPDPES